MNYQARVNTGITERAHVWDQKDGEREEEDKIMRNYKSTQKKKPKKKQEQAVSNAPR